MTPNVLLYLKGPPGSGKVTTARIIQKQLGWTLFWVHDLDQIIRDVIGAEGARTGKHRKLLDRMTEPILEHLLAERKSTIYVRPSRSPETVAAVKALARRIDPNCRVYVVNLWASHETLVKRVEGREPSGLRVHSRAELDEYLNARQQINDEGECMVNTDSQTPAEAALYIMWAIGYDQRSLPLLTEE